MRIRLRLVGAEEVLDRSDTYRKRKAPPEKKPVEPIEKEEEEEQEESEDDAPVTRGNGRILKMVVSDDDEFRSSQGATSMEVLQQMV